MHKCPICKAEWECQLGNKCEHFPHKLTVTTPKFCSNICEQTAYFLIMIGK